MAHFVMKYLKTRTSYWKSDYIFGEVTLFSIDITFKIMGGYPIIVPKN